MGDVENFNVQVLIQFEGKKNPDLIEWFLQRYYENSKPPSSTKAAGVLPAHYLNFQTFNNCGKYEYAKLPGSDQHRSSSLQEQKRSSQWVAATARFVYLLFI